MSKVDRERDALLLPALDRPGGGVQWGSVAKLVNMVREGNTISKHLRYSLKTRLTCGEEFRVLNTLTVLHTISLNGSLEVRKQLADTKHLKLLEKVYMSFENGLPAAAVCQMLIDWAFMFSNEDLGQKSARLMKHLRSKGAPALRHTRIAAERREEMTLGVPILRFMHGMDFASPAMPSSAEQQSDAVRGQDGGPPQQKQSKLKKLKKLFTRAPSTPARLLSGSLLRPQQYLPGSHSQQKAKATLPSWVDELLNRMPVDAEDLKEVLKSIENLKQNGGSQSDIAGMMAATEPLAKKVKTWSAQALELVASQVDNIAAEMMPSEGNGSVNQPDMVLEGSKLTTLLETNDEVQKIVADWNRLEQEVTGRSYSAIPGEVDLPGEQKKGKKSMRGSGRGFIRRSSSVVIPQMQYQTEGVQESPFSASQSAPRRLQSATEAGQEESGVNQAGAEPCYDPEIPYPDYNIDYDDPQEPVSGTPPWMGATDSPLLEGNMRSPFGGDPVVGEVAIAEESYSPGALAAYNLSDVSNLPPAAPRTSAGVIHERHRADSRPRKGGNRDGIIHSFDSDTVGSPRGGIYTTPLESAYNLWTGYPSLSTTAGERSDDFEGVSRNPFRRASNAESSLPAPATCQRNEESGAADRAKPTKVQEDQEQSPFQGPAKSKGRVAPVAVSEKKLLTAESNDTAARISPFAAAPASSVRAVPVSPHQSEPTRLCELSSSTVGIHVEEPGPTLKTVTAQSFTPLVSRQGSYDACDGVRQMRERRASTPPPTCKNVEPIMTTKVGVLLQRRGSCEGGRAAKPAGNHGHEESMRTEETKGRTAVRLRPSHRTSRQRSSPPSVTRRKTGYSGLRRAYRNGPKPRAHSEHRAAPFASFENKFMGTRNGAPPKFDRASLDTLRDDRSRTIPALRVRFTAEHLRDVIERMGDQRKARGVRYGRG